MSLMPEPPVGVLLDSGVQEITTVTMAALAVGALLYSLIDGVRHGRPTLLLLYLAGGTMMLIEPLVDVVGACWFPVNGQVVVFTAYGRPMPLWLCLVYFPYFGLGVGLAYRFLRRGMTPRQIWLLYAAFALGDTCLEVPLLHFGPTIYYGNQPLRIFLFPAWWAAVNSLVAMVTAGVIHRFDRYLSGVRQILIIPIALSVSTAMNCAAGWPSWLVINTDVGPALTQVGGLATWALAWWFMRLLIEAVAVRPGQSEHAAWLRPMPGQAPEPQAAASADGLLTTGRSIHGISPP